MKPECGGCGASLELPDEVNIRWLGPHRYSIKNRRTDGLIHECPGILGQATEIIREAEAMTLTPGIRHHDHWSEVDTRFATPQAVEAAREYASELCGHEYSIGEALLICLREKGDSHCEDGKHGYYRALERALRTVSMEESLGRSLQQDGQANA